MPVTQPSSSSKPAKVEAEPTTSRALKRMRQVIILVLLIIPIFVAWQVLNYVINNTDPTVAGRPLSNPKTHLHQVALGGKPGIIYLGTHYGFFSSTDGGRSWPQQRGKLNTLMILNIVVSPANPQVLAVIGRPTSGLGNLAGIYFSSDGGNSWQTLTD